MGPDRRLAALLGIEHPIVQAPMRGSCSPALAAAVSNAGGLGSFGCGGAEADEILDSAARIRSATNRPFNLNVFVADGAPTSADALARTRERLAPRYAELGLGRPPDRLPASDKGFDDEHVAAILSVRPNVLSFHFGCPGPEVVAELKSAGILLISSATNVTEARALEAAGMDAVIAQGWEAGGHRGSHAPAPPWEGIGTMALVPQVVDAVRVPVIAAGGIADGRGIAAALALGAAGVQLGTAFLRCPEAATDSARRARLAAARDTDTMITDAVSGRPARALRSRYAEEMARHPDDRAAFPQMYALSDPILVASEPDAASFQLYGQAAALGREMPAGELVATLVAETRAVMAGLSVG